MRIKTLRFFSTAAALLIIGFIIGRYGPRDQLRPATPPSNGAVSFASKLHVEESLKRDDGDRTTNFPTGSSTPQSVNTADREQEFCRRLEALGAENPAQAFQLAKTGSTPRQREIFRNAALRGWASRDVKGAVDWMLIHVQGEDRRAAAEAIALGAVANPIEAEETFKRLLEADPTRASDHGNALVNALSRIGRYDLASHFAVYGPSEYRAGWLCTIFSQWAAYEPATALRALSQLPSTPDREQAQSSLFAGWSMSDPAGLVTYAQSLPPSEVRGAAMKDGLEQWVHRDPAAASAWMDGYDPNPDLDAGAAAIALNPVIVSRRPEVAASWAESITDPTLRECTLLDLIRVWGEHDAAAARRYAASSSALRPESRQLALSALQPAP